MTDALRRRPARDLESAMMMGKLHVSLEAFKDLGHQNHHLDFQDVAVGIFYDLNPKGVFLSVIVDECVVAVVY